MSLGFSPDPDLLDPVGLFTHGEFQCFQNEDPDLLLFTHGEFPRPGIAAPTGKPGAKGEGQGAGVAKRRRRLYQPQVQRINDDIEAISIALLFAEDEDDDIESWF